jgi:hypothetical protein
MKAQGYGVKENVFFQDNTISILLEKWKDFEQQSHEAHQH